jgi:hypothetical protein
MWLELIKKLLSETNLTYLDADLPLAVFMIKLLHTRIKFDKFINLQIFQDYLEYTKSIELRYFIQCTLKDEINEECLLKEKEIEDEIKALDEMFFEYHDEQPFIITPSYEYRIILYQKYMEGKDFKSPYQYYWKQENVNFLSTGTGLDVNKTWTLQMYYKYFKNEIINRNNILILDRSSKLYINKYRKIEKDILQILNKFNTEEDFNKLLKSIRCIKLMEKQESLIP